MAVTRATTRVWLVLAKTGKLWTIRKAYNNFAKAERYKRNQVTMEIKILEIDIE